MTNGLLNFLPNAVGQGQATVTYAEVTFPAPATFSDPLYVIEPDWTAEFSHQIASWPACHGVTLPLVGDVVLLITDSRGVRRCVWWEGQMTFSTQTSQKYYLTTASSNIAGHKEVTAAPVAVKTTVPFSNLVNGQLLLDYATPSGIPGTAFLPAGQFEFHVHALQLTGNETIRMYAEFWEYDPNSSTHVAMIGVSSPSKPLTAREIEYRLFFSTNDVYAFVSAGSRVVVHVRVLVGGSGGASIRYFVGGSSDSHIVIPAGNLSSGIGGIGANWRGIWNSGITYAVGDGVTGSDRHNYVSLVPANLNHNPVGNNGVHWSDLIPPSVISIGNTPSESGTGGDQFLARSDGTVHRFTPVAVSAQAWGAKFDGATDDTTALQSASTAAGSGGRIACPPGTAIVSNFAFQAEYQLLEGAGMLATKLKAKAAATAVINNQGLRGNRCKSMTLDGNAGASKCFYTAATAGATSQDTGCDFVQFQNYSIGYHIGNAGLTQADKNTLERCRWLPGAVASSIGVQNDSVNGQQTILNQPDFGLSANNQIAVKLNNGGSLGILGGQVQGNGVATGLTSILMTGGNVDRVWLKDFIDENVDISIDGSGGWPYLGVILEQCTLQGATANVKMGAAAGGSGGARLYATLCTFNAGATVGAGVINSTGSDAQNTTILEDCNNNRTLPVFTGNLVRQPGETPRAVGAASQPAFAADFANYANGYRPMVFYMDRSGVVHVEGVVTTALGQAADTTVFTLPVGYRPKPNERVTGDGVRVSDNAFMRWDVTPTGDVKTELVLGAGQVGSITMAFVPQTLG